MKRRREQGRDYDAYDPVVGRWKRVRHAPPAPPVLRNVVVRPPRLPPIATLFETIVVRSAMQLARLSDELREGFATSLDWVSLDMDIFSFDARTALCMIQGRIHDTLYRIQQHAYNLVRGVGEVRLP
jgi:hypothetical protein